MDIPVYVLTYKDQLVRLGSYSQVTISKAPSVFYSEKPAAFRAGQRGWCGFEEIAPNTLKIKKMRLVEV